MVGMLMVLSYYFISNTCVISVFLLTIFAYRMLTHQGCGNTKPMCGSRGGTGVWTLPPPPPPPPLENHKNIGFFSNTGPDPLKIVKLPSQHSILGHNRYASETPFNSGIWIIPPPIKLKKKVEPPLTKLSGSPHDTPLV